MLSNFYRFLHILFLRRKKRLVHIRNRSGYEKNDSAVDDDDKVVRWIWVGVEASLVLTRTSSHGTGSETKTKLISDRVLFVDVQTMFTYTSTLLLQQLLKYRAHLKKSYHHFNWWVIFQPFSYIDLLWTPPIFGWCIKQLNYNTLKFKPL
jgi:hypothetical protein